MPSPPADPRPDAERLRALIERTGRLHRVTAHLSSAVDRETVAGIVVDEGTEALGALSGALWLLDDKHHELRLLRARHYPPEVQRTLEHVPLDPAYPIADAVVNVRPVWLSSRADYQARYPTSATRTRGMMSEHIYSVAALPIVLGDEALGVLALTFPGEHGFDEDDRTYLQFLALHCAQGFERARLYELERAAHERAVFLAKASEVLGSSLDYEQTLTNVAALAVPTMGDWFGADLLDEHAEPKQVAVGHVDPAKVEQARELRRRYPPNPAASAGFYNVLRTRCPELYPDVTDDMLVASAIDSEHLRITRELGLRSVMIVPVVDRDRVLGALTFVRSSAHAPYLPDDLLMAEQLAQRVGAAISNALLYAAARDAVRVRDEFMLVAGHELRTPIAALLLSHEALQNLSDATPVAKVRDRADKLVAQTMRLSRLVESLLDVSRVSTGRMELEHDDLDLADLVRAELEKAGCALSVDLHPARGRWDRNRLDQVVTNLLGNAMKYGKGTPIDVKVRCANGVATLEVTDRGIGIAERDQQRIFERFERAASPRNFSGLGLGLWIASELVRAHGGTIGVASAPGEGARFTVTLPLAPVASH